MIITLCKDQNFLCELNGYLSFVLQKPNSFLVLFFYNTFTSEYLFLHSVSIEASSYHLYCLTASYKLCSMTRAIFGSGGRKEAILISCISARSSHPFYQSLPAITLWYHFAMFHWSRSSRMTTKMCICFQTSIGMDFGYMCVYRYEYHIPIIRCGYGWLWFVGDFFWYVGMFVFCKTFSFLWLAYCIWMIKGKMYIDYHHSWAVFLDHKKKPNGQILISSLMFTSPHFTVSPSIWLYVITCSGSM